MTLVSKPGGRAPGEPRVQGLQRLQHPPARPPHHCLLRLSAAAVNTAYAMHCHTLSIL